VPGFVLSEVAGTAVALLVAHVLHGRPAAASRPSPHGD